MTNDGDRILVTDHEMSWETGAGHYGSGAFLDFYDGSLRMKGEYIRGIKNGIWKYYVQGSSSRFYNLDFKDGNITSAEYKDNDKAWSGIPMLYSENDTTIRTGVFLVQQMLAFTICICFVKGMQVKK